MIIIEYTYKKEDEDKKKKNKRWNKYRLKNHK